jgi:hypothetical protein
MPGVVSYPSLTSATVAPDADALYVVDATGPSDKQATLRALFNGCIGLPVVTDATTARTLSDSDHGKFLRFTNNANVAVSVPSTLRSDFRCRVIQDGGGKVTLTGTNGATVRTKGNQTATGGLYHILDVQCVATNEFRAWGDTVSL